MCEAMHSKRESARRTNNTFLYPLRSMIGAWDSVAVIQTQQAHKAREGKMTIPSLEKYIGAIDTLGIARHPMAPSAFFSCDNQ